MVLVVVWVKMRLASRCRAYIEIGTEEEVGRHRRLRVDGSIKQWRGLRSIFGFYKKNYVLHLEDPATYASCSIQYFRSGGPEFAVHVGWCIVKKK